MLWRKNAPGSSTTFRGLNRFYFILKHSLCDGKKQMLFLHTTTVLPGREELPSPTHRGDDNTWTEHKYAWGKTWTCMRQDMGGTNMHEEIHGQNMNTVYIFTFKLGYMRLLTCFFYINHNSNSLSKDNYSMPAPTVGFRIVVLLYRGWIIAVKCVDRGIVPCSLAVWHWGIHNPAFLSHLTARHFPASQTWLHFQYHATWTVVTWYRMI